MDTSFIVLGTSMLLSTLVYREFHKTRGSRIGFILMSLGGVGTIFLGVFPMNLVGVLHVFGGTLTLIGGNLAILILGLSLDISPKFQAYSLISSGIALVGSIFYAAHIFFGIGQGTLELIAASLQALWLIILGFYMTHSNFRFQPSD